MRDVVLGPCDVAPGAAEVHRSGARHPRIAPRHRARQCEVDLRGRVSVPEPGEPPPEARGKPVAGDAQERPGGHIQDHRPGRGELVERAHLGVRDDLAPVRDEVCDEGIDDGLGSSARNRPAASVRVRLQGESRTGAHEAGLTDDRVRRDARDHRRGGLVAEPQIPQRSPLFEGAHTEEARRERMPRDLQQIRPGELGDLQ